MKRIVDIFIGTLFGILAAVFIFLVVFLTARTPTGQSIELQPTVSPQPIVVYVLGAVRYPGVYSLAPDSRVIDAVQAAGGFLDSALVVEVNVASRLEDGQRLRNSRNRRTAHPGLYHWRWWSVSYPNPL
jgi:hypothetical protein